VNSVDPPKAPKAFVVVSRSETRLVLKASRGGVIRQVGLCLWATLFLAISPTIITWFEGDEFPGGLACVAYGAAGMLGLAGLWFLRQAVVCLVVGHDGRVEYGRRTLCAEGGVQKIVVRCKKDPDHDQFDVCIQTQDGQCLDLPYYMSSFYSQHEADELAEELSDPRYVEARMAMIPDASAYANGQAGPEPEVKGNSRRALRQHDEWGQRWNVAFHSKMAEMARSLGASA
jgi:hypothetical protein